MSESMYAFPSEDRNCYYYGMSLKAYFAGQVLTWLVNEYFTDTQEDIAKIAKLAMQIAEATIKELNGSQNN